MGCVQAWVKCPSYSASSASTCEGRRACSPQGQGACLVWGRKGPWSCHSFSKRTSVKDPEPMLLHGPWEGCSIDLSPIPPGLKQGLAHGALSLLMGATGFPGSLAAPSSPLPLWVLCHPHPPSSFQPLLILWCPGGFPAEM